MKRDQMGRRYNEVRHLVIRHLRVGKQTHSINLNSVIERQKEFDTSYSTIAKLNESDLDVIRLAGPRNASGDDHL